jgi:hypothetical protein
VQAAIGNLINTAAKVTLQRANTIKALQDQQAAQRQALDLALKAQIMANDAYAAQARACNCTPPIASTTTSSSSSSSSMSALIPTQDQVTAQLAAMYVPNYKNVSDLVDFLKRVDTDMTVTGRTTFLASTSDKSIAVIMWFHLSCFL